MAGVILRKVRKALGKTVAVYDIDLRIEAREFVVLVGPSGCGGAKRTSAPIRPGSMNGRVRGEAPSWTWDAT